MMYDSLYDENTYRWGLWMHLSMTEHKHLRESLFRLFKSTDGIVQPTDVVSVDTYKKSMKHYVAIDFRSKWMNEIIWCDRRWWLCHYLYNYNKILSGKDNISIRIVPIAKMIAASKQLNTYYVY